MFDIDHFKRINDTYGHKTGDYVLENLAVIIKQNIREVDFFARYGGEEFIILLLNSSKEQTLLKAEELRKVVSEYSFKGIDQITISLGVCEYLKEDTYESITSKVDKAMYEAKENGRNRVCCFENVVQNKKI